jgi:hypothetical protein
LVENTRKASEYICPVCKRPFCQRCSQIWHPNLTCDLASTQRAAQDPTLEMLMKSSLSGGNIRPCPRCKCFFFQTIEIFQIFNLSIRNIKVKSETFLQ